MPVAQLVAVSQSVEAASVFQVKVKFFKALMVQPFRITASQSLSLAGPGSTVGSQLSIAFE